MRILVYCVTLLVAISSPALVAQEAQPLTPIVTEQLHNVWQLSPRVISGSEPENEAAFAELAKLGIKTIVSVDGIQPQVELARKYGLRYVHVPIGYDAIDPGAQGSLVRASKEIKGKIYVHCHHGKHRGPAAAAVLCRADDGRSAIQAKMILEKAGTSREYAGLWRDVEAFHVPADFQKLPALVERAQVDSLAASMANIDRTFDRLKQLQQNKWQALPDHPDVVANQEALQLEELFTESARLASGEMKSGLTQSAQLFEQLRSAINKPDPASANALMKKLNSQCTACHQSHRNN